MRAAGNSNIYSQIGLIMLVGLMAKNGSWWSSLPINCATGAPR